jgi:hypothetical protein
MITTEPAALFGGLEWFLLILSTIGVLVNGYGIREAWYDRKAVIESGINHGRRGAANRNLRCDAVLLVYMLLTLWTNFAGILAAPTPSQVAPSAQTWFLYGSEIIKIVMLTALSVAGQFDYFRIRHEEHP